MHIWATIPGLRAQTWGTPPPGLCCRGPGAPSLRTRPALYSEKRFKSYQHIFSIISSYYISFKTWSLETRWWRWLCNIYHSMAEVEIISAALPWSSQCCLARSACLVSDVWSYTPSSYRWTVLCPRKIRGNVSLWIQRKQSNNAHKGKRVNVC